MAAPAIQSQTSPEQLITVKVLFDDKNRRFKLPLKDLKAQVFPQKLRDLLGVPADVNVIFERYSDSAGSYILLDDSNTAVYKQLYRAAKAKLKLRIRASTLDLPVLASADNSTTEENPQEPARHSYLETVLSSPMPVAQMDTLPASSEMPPRIPGMLTDQKEKYLLANPLRQMTLPVGQPRHHHFELKSDCSHPRYPLENPLQQASLPLGQPSYRDFEMEQDSNLRFPVISHASHDGMFCIDCNNCNRSIADEHYHCSICEGGDYDLCPQCVYAGATCREEGHWLIKRGVVNGVVTNSTTETIPSRSPLNVQDNRTATAGMALKSESVPQPVTDKAARGLPPFHKKSGHSLRRPFDLNRYSVDELNDSATRLGIANSCFVHAAICDGCDKRIFGVRHKCLSCPDWDYCSKCAVGAKQSHPGHRFVPIYEALDDLKHDSTMHYGIFCDGPQCKNKPAQSYITGVRYKCAVCDDVDFCANCEAMPLNPHNRSHPLIKFKTPVRAVTVSTVNEGAGSGTVTLGDNSRVAHLSGVNLESKQPFVKQVPVEVGNGKPVETDNTGATPDSQSSNAQASAIDQDPQYFAYFVRDAIPDGTKLSPNTTVRQTWTLYNPGPNAWPVGSGVRFVGGDTMFNVDAEHPSSVDSIRSAMESNQLTAPVEVGQSADFSVTLRTPDREGTAISYWRLKLPNGLAIGHRLWCDLQVSSSASVEDVPTSTMNAEKTEAPEITSSGMIFPKLEKESPESSTHEATARVQHAPALSNASEKDIMEDVESLTLDEASTDAGFLTDEEYDVLNASDQEFQEAKQSTH